MVPLRLLLIVLVLGVAFAGALGLYQSVPVVWNATWQRLTNKVPLVQETVFEEDGYYASIIEAKSEIRPGDTFNITVRGMKYEDVDNAIKVTYKVQTEDTTFVKNITPPLVTFEIDAQSDYILPPIDMKIETNQLASSPSKIQFRIIQIVTGDEGGEEIQSTPVFLSIAIDNSPFPTGDVVKALISLVAFLLGIFGAKLAIGV